MSEKFRKIRIQNLADEGKVLRKLSEIDKFLCNRMHAACNGGKPHVADFYNVLLDNKYKECEIGIREIRKSRMG
ncbi:MAG: hypothetical protein WCY41_00915 [Candidatus Micrarchaeia archaeon]